MEDESGPVQHEPGTTPPPEQAMQYSPREDALLDALSANPRLASIYLGSCVARRDRSNPERLPHTAHSLRELMDLMPEVVEAPIPTEPPGLKAKVNELHASFQSLAKTRGT